MNKNIFNKCNNNNNNNSNNSNKLSNIDNIDIDSINSDELSDELNSIIGNKPNKKTNNDIETKFDIDNMYNNISLEISNYKMCKITGEIIKFKITGENAWIDIKYKDYQLLGVFWRISKDKNFNMLKTLKPGDQISSDGDFGIFKNNLKIYFNIRTIEKLGKGDYLELYEKYRIKIKELNLGIPKKKIKHFPYTIGIITALEGAAIQDIIQTLKIDKFIGNVIIKNSIVQGSQCSKSIINSIDWFEKNYLSQIDILMITRGGGSYDDLVGFSNWDLLIKISSSSFITLSAVGHQIDNQLSDEVCDYKFATPSIGAKFIVETQHVYKNNLFKHKYLFENVLNNYLTALKRFKNITTNYSNIIKKYDIKNMFVMVKKYQLAFKKILTKYHGLKDDFYSKLSDIKPTLIRSNEIKKNIISTELTSINDFIDITHNKEIKPKKIEIYFIDGMIKISYKIIEYEQY